MSHSVRRHLRVEIEAYDRTIRAFIPSYEEMLERAALAVAEARPRRVIDLGAGTGALAQAVLQKCEGKRRSILIDADAEMLEQAQERLWPPFRIAGPATPSAPFQGPLPPCDVGGCLPGAAPRFHAGGETEDLRCGSRGACPPGGVFVNADADHARRPRCPAGRLPRPGLPTSSPAASGRSRPGATSRNGRAKTPTSLSRRSWPRWRMTGFDDGHACGGRCPWRWSGPGSGPEGGSTTTLTTGAVEGILSRRRPDLPTPEDRSSWPPCPFTSRRNGRPGCAPTSSIATSAASRPPRAELLVHVIRATEPCSGPGGYHSHDLEFQMNYVLRGWTRVEFEDVGEVRFEAGDSWHQDPMTPARGAGVLRRLRGHRDLHARRISPPGTSSVELIQGRPLGFCRKWEDWTARSLRSPAVRPASAKPPCGASWRRVRGWPMPTATAPAASASPEEIEAAGGEALFVEARMDREAEAAAFIRRAVGSLRPARHPREQRRHPSLQHGDRSQRGELGRHLGGERQGLRLLRQGRDPLPCAKAAREASSTSPPTARL